MTKVLLPKLALTVLFLSCQAHALTFDKPVTSTVRISPQNSNTPAGFASANHARKKTVMLMNIKLNAQQKQALHHFNRSQSKPSFELQTPGLPQQADRGMNGVPVLDQGQHGTCTTFATTAAIDALLGKGDYISQLCNLELGSYFEEKGYLPSGWDGTSGPLVLNQIMGFGIMNKDNQRAKTCGGLKDYPQMNPFNVGTSISLEDYKESSENINDHLDWEPILNFSERFEWDESSGKQADALLIAVKKSLATKRTSQDSRLTFGTLLPVSYCSAGACARYHSDEDTWALTNAIINDPDPQFGGHEMVITGYDDNAIALDNEGTKHKGLLILRNSWGREAGDQGTYYMTYDFFKEFVLEVQEIIAEKEAS